MICPDYEDSLSFCCHCISFFGVHMLSVLQEFVEDDLWIPQFRTLHTSSFRHSVECDCKAIQSCCDQVDAI
jgi:hypothetical protein